MGVAVDRDLIYRFPLPPIIMSPAELAIPPPPLQIFHPFPVSNYTAQPMVGMSDITGFVVNSPPQSISSIVGHTAFLSTLCHENWNEDENAVLKKSGCSAEKASASLLDPHSIKLDDIRNDGSGSSAYDLLSDDAQHDVEEKRDRVSQADTFDTPAIDEEDIEDENVLRAKLLQSLARTRQASAEFELVMPVVQESTCRVVIHANDPIYSTANDPMLNFKVTLNQKPGQAHVIPSVTFPTPPRNTSSFSIWQKSKDFLVTSRPPLPMPAPARTVIRGSNKFQVPFESIYFTKSLLSDNEFGLSYHRHLPGPQWLGGLNSH